MNGRGVLACLLAVSLLTVTSCSQGSDSADQGSSGTNQTPNGSVKISDFASESAVEAAVRAGLDTKGDVSSRVQDQLVDLSGKGSDLTSSAIASCNTAPDNSTAVSIGSCTFGDRTARSTIVLTGDSRAAMWFDVYDQIATSEHVKLVVLIKSGCPAALASFSVVSEKGVPTNQIWSACTSWHDFVIKTVAGLRPSVVVNSSASTLFLNGSTSYATDAATTTAFKQFYASIPRPIHQIVLGGFPNVGGDTNPVLCLSKSSEPAKCKSQIPERVQERNADQKAAATSVGATFVDQSRWTCYQNSCPAVINGLVPYTLDGYHVNREYSRYLTGVMWSAIKPYIGA